MISRRLSLNSSNFWLLKIWNDDNLNNSNPAEKIPNSKNGHHFQKRQPFPKMACTLRLVNCKPSFTSYCFVSKYISEHGSHLPTLEGWIAGSRSGKWSLGLASDLRSRNPVGVKVQSVLSKWYEQTRGTQQFLSVLSDVLDLDRSHTLAHSTRRCSFSGKQNMKAFSSWKGHCLTLQMNSLLTRWFWRLVALLETWGLATTTLAVMWISCGSLIVRMRCS